MTHSSRTAAGRHGGVTYENRWQKADLVNRLQATIEVGKNERNIMDWPLKLVICLVYREREREICQASCEGNRSPDVSTL